MNFDLADGIRMVDEVTKVGFRLKSLFKDPQTLLSVSVRHNIFFHDPRPIFLSVRTIFRVRESLSEAIF